jgi:hypothetical protein
MAPFKMLLDVLKMVLLVKETLADPTKINAVIAQATKMLLYLPQAAVPLMLKGLMQVFIDLINVVVAKISEIQRLIKQEADISVAIYLDPNLLAVKTKVSVQVQNAKTELAEMLEPITIVFDIVGTFCEIIGVKSPVPIDTMTEDLEILKQNLYDMQAEIRGFVEYMGG